MNSVEVWWQSFREGRFSRDCSRIEFTKNGSDKITYQGPGELWQEDDGTLAFKCFCYDAAGSTIGHILEDAAASRPGKLLPRDAYYSVHVVTFDGAEWNAEDVSLDRNYSIVTAQVVVAGKLRSLKQVQRTPRPSEHHSIRLLFIGQRLDVWKALAGSEISCEEIGCSIRVLTERGSEVLVEITSNNDFATNFEIRVVEALRYVLATIVHVSVIGRSADGVVETTLISPVRTSETRLFPPLMARSPNDWANVRRMFERYLTFVHSQTSTEFVHPCSMHLRMACEASANAVEAEAIGLCVALEGIANLVPYERNKAEDTAIATIRRVISRWLKKRGFQCYLRNRVEGLLSQLKNIRVQDRLKSLIETGHLDASSLITWKRLRNHGVHSKHSKLDELDDRRFQELLDDVHQVYVCMYQITFALIGYKGPFSNYASEGFKVETYPKGRP